MLLEHPNSCLHVDGTTDHQRHFYGYQVSTTSLPSMAICMVETVCGDTTTQINQLCTVLEDFAQLLSSKNDESQALYDNMLVNVKI